MKIGVGLMTSLLAVVLAADYCEGVGLLSALGLGNPLMGAMPPMPAYPAYGSYGCGNPALGALGMNLASRLAYSKVPSLGLGCPSTCCFVHTKPCLLTKLLLLKKKLLEKKMSLCSKCGYKCGGCKCGCGCGCM